ncbi:MAG TPA: DUF2007 domain-containing protein [Chloroflexota bacterium]
MRASWVRVATAPNQVIAEVWRDTLTKEGIAAMVDPSATASYLGVSSFPVAVLVEAGRLADARAILGTYLAALDESAAD